MKCNDGRNRGRCHEQTLSLGAADNKVIRLLLLLLLWSLRKNISGSQAGFQMTLYIHTYTEHLRVYTIIKSKCRAHTKCIYIRIYVRPMVAVGVDEIAEIL